jgi:thiosulfate reductase cytochrome b subunit
MNRMYLYTLYQRVWHWTQAAIMLLLISSGLEIHLPDTVRLFGFARAIQVHNWVAAVLIANAFLGLFYYVTTGEIRQLAPQTRNFLLSLGSQLRYYASGIFHGAQHPHVKQPASRLNPLQRLTYIVVLNVLLPLQAVTGILIWGAQYWPQLAQRLGGLRGLAAAHALGAWLFCAFLLAHLYLITTGHRPATNLQAMLTGWEPVPASVATPEATINERKS